MNGVIENVCNDSNAKIGKILLDDLKVIKIFINFLHLTSDG
jgi:hypothetical protein